MRLIVGISGSSGVIYGIRLLQLLSKRQDIETHLILTQSARMNIGIETDWATSDVESMADVVHNNKNISANIASGSYRTCGMIVAPCSMKTLSGIVNSYSDNLITRAADVVLKEQRRLILVPRETPLHLGHCELLARACQLGAMVHPPSPAFYTRPKTVDDIIDQTVARLLDMIGVEVSQLVRWRGNQ